MIQGTVLFFSKYPFFVFVKNATAYETTIPYFHRKVKKYPHCLFGNTVFRFGHGVLPTDAPPCSDGRKIPCGENLFCRLQSGKAIRQRSLNAKKQDKRGRKKRTAAEAAAVLFIWRRKRDSNPRAFWENDFQGTSTCRKLRDFRRRYRTIKEAESPVFTRVFGSFLFESQKILAP